VLANEALNDRDRVILSADYRPTLLCGAFWHLSEDSRIETHNYKCWLKTHCTNLPDWICLALSLIGSVHISQ